MSDRLASGSRRSLRQRLLSGGLWSFSAKVLVSLLFVLVNGLITRKLSPEEVGTYFLIVSMVGLLASFGQLGTGRAAVRFIASLMAQDHVSAARETAARVLRLCVGGALAVGALYLGASNLGLLEIFDAPGVESVTIATTVWIVLLALNRNLSDVFLGFQDVRTSSLIGHSTDGVFQAALLALALVFFAAGGTDLSGLMVMSVLATAASVSIGMVLLVREGLPFLRATLEHASTPGTKEILQTSLPMMLTAVMAYTVSYKFELWIIGVMGEPEDLALYGAAIRLMLLITAPLMVVNSVVPPIVAELHSKENLPRLEAVLRGTATLAGVPATMVLVVFALVGGTVLSAVFGPFYAGAWQYLVVIGLGQVSNVVAGSCGIALMMTGHEVLRMKVLLVTSGIGIVAGIWAMSVFGVLGLAVASAAKYTLQNAVLVLLARRELGVWTHASLSPAQIKRSIRLLGR